MKIKETRTITSNEVRSLCIKNEYYTCGTCNEYENMLSMCHYKEATTELLLKVAQDIWEHSSQERILYQCGCTEKEILENLLYGLINDCCYTTVDIIE